MKLLALAFLASAAVAAQPVTEGKVRAFLAAQERAWNAGDLGAYFASFTPDAVFVDQALASDNTIKLYGKSTLAQARAQAKKALASAQVKEEAQVIRIAIAPDGRSARAETFQTTRISGKVAPRTACGRREQTLVLSGGRLKSQGETETVVRCRRG